MKKRSESNQRDGGVASNGHSVSYEGAHSDASGEQRGEDNRKVELGRKVTLLRGISIIIGTIIGAGIFISPKGILKHSGSIGMSLIVWIACGVLSLFGALCYAELGTCIKKSGGHYTYIMEAFGPQVAFIRLWVDLVAIRPAGMAVISLAFGQYILEPLFMSCEIPQIAVKLASAIGLTSVMYLNSMSVTWTARVQIVLTFSKLLATAIIIVPGMYQLFKAQYLPCVTDWQTWHSGLEYRTLQQDIGLPPKPQTPDSSDWQSHLLHSSAQHRRPPGLCARPAPAHVCTPVTAVPDI